MDKENKEISQEISATKSGIYKAIKSYKFKKRINR
jgi:hypothetical protein